MDTTFDRDRIKSADERAVNARASLETARAELRAALDKARIEFVKDNCPMTPQAFAEITTASVLTDEVEIDDAVTVYRALKRYHNAVGELHRAETDQCHTFLAAQNRIKNRIINDGEEAS